MRPHTLPTPSLRSFRTTHIDPYDAGSSTPPPFQFYLSSPDSSKVATNTLKFRVNTLGHLCIQNQYTAKQPRFTLDASSVHSAIVIGPALAQFRLAGL